ncbi:MAG TPA: hypothetical protein PLV83_02285 [Bacilli bacterium]|nr:hypothetical protein [Bacilli bacterium]
MIDIYIGIGIFLITYLCYLLIIINSKKRLIKYIENSKETNMIKKRYNINYKKLNHKMVANIFGLSNGLILCVTYIIMSLIKGVILKFVIALFVMMFLVVIVYLQIGKFLKKKEV